MIFCDGLFNAAVGEGLDEALLEEQEDDQQRRNGEEGSSTGVGPGCADFCLLGEDGKAYGEKTLVDGVDGDQRPEEVVPLIGSCDQTVSDEAGNQQRQVNLDDHNEQVAAVNARGFFQFVGDGLDCLSHQEGTHGRGEEGH